MYQRIKKPLLDCLRSKEDPTPATENENQASPPLQSTNPKLKGKKSKYTNSNQWQSGIKKLNLKICKIRAGAFPDCKIGSAGSPHQAFTFLRWKEYHKSCDSGLGRREKQRNTAYRYSVDIDRETEAITHKRGKANRQAQRWRICDSKGIFNFFELVFHFRSMKLQIKYLG